ncbi:hypothetical protein [Bdellovibrio reynosensis]|uniref:Lipoprotein n=1 Tax=Bdellovibrio reynosensis TaxID=2835041 RepID=A0ABY4CCB2_9BACT|nr:hypothetical protein [Bdellovibrio reynosensis]UOF02535.1 hypothetical protein MNR06_06165 [Bdellovibrio reynosensis]
MKPASIFAMALVSLILSACAQNGSGDGKKGTLNNKNVSAHNRTQCPAVDGSYLTTQDGRTFRILITTAKFDNTMEFAADIDLAQGSDNKTSLRYTIDGKAYENQGLTYIGVCSKGQIGIAFYQNKKVIATYRISVKGNVLTTITVDEKGKSDSLNWNKEY